jgi:hypothetical protein
MKELGFEPLAPPESGIRVPKRLDTYYFVLNTPRNWIFCPKYVGKLLKSTIPCADVRTYEKSLTGTYYDSQTPKTLRTVLDGFIGSSERVKLHYGDSDTGELWGDVEVGYLGRSSGFVSRPIILPNIRSSGGPEILDSCILIAEYANKNNGGVRYKHPRVK